MCFFTSLYSLLISLLAEPNTFHEEPSLMAPSPEIHLLDALAATGMCGRMHHNTFAFIAVKYITAQFSASQFIMVWNSAVPSVKTLHCTVEYITTVYHTTVLYIWMQHNTMQYIRIQSS